MGGLKDGRHSHIKGITRGTSSTTFSPQEKLSEKEFVAFQLRALGYDPSEAWNNAVTIAISAGIVANNNSLESMKYTKADAADVMFAALNAKIQGVIPEVKLIDHLVKRGVVDKENAIAVGFKITSSENESTNDTKLNDGIYRISVSNVGVDNKGTYINFQTETHYYLLLDYVYKCEQHLGTIGWDDAVVLGEYYYNNNYPIEVIENGETRYLNIQELANRTTLNRTELYEQLFSFYSVSGGLEILDVFSKNATSEYTVYLSSSCTFEYCYISNFGEKKFITFDDNVNALREAIYNSYNARLDSIEIQVRDSHIIKVVEIYMP